MVQHHPQLNRIDHYFGRLRAQGRKAFVAYITAGDPNLKITAELAYSFERIGVDILELGVPFSDPLADGVVNRTAADRALKAGVTLVDVLRMITELRRKGLTIPLVLFTYFNPIHQYGIEKFVQDATRAGVDGILNLDLPPEESSRYAALMKNKELYPIYLIAPTTDPSRIAGIARKARGFIYYVSQEGVTGVRKSLARGIASKIREIRRHTRTPIVVGFGISTPQQVSRVARIADGCVVGSAIVRRIGDLSQNAKLVPIVTRFVQSLVGPLRGR